MGTKNETAVTKMVAALQDRGYSKPEAKRVTSWLAPLESLRKTGSAK